MLNHFFLAFLITLSCFVDNPGRSIKPQSRAQLQYLLNFKVNVYILQYSVRMVTKKFAIVIGSLTSHMSEENAA